MPENKCGTAVPSRRRHGLLQFAPRPYFLLLPALARLPLRGFTGAQWRALLNFQQPRFGCRPSQKLPCYKSIRRSAGAIGTVVGRPGFEPGLSASKADDLPLVDRPVFAANVRQIQTAMLRTFRAPGKGEVHRFGWSRRTGSYSLREHPLPVPCAPERFCQKRSRAQSLHTLLSLARGPWIWIDPEQRRA